MLTARWPCQHRDPAHSRKGLACLWLLSCCPPAGPEGPSLPGSKLSQQFLLSVFPEERAKPGHQLIRDCDITEMWVPRLGARSAEVGGFDLNPLSSSAFTQAVILAVLGSSPLC